MVFSDDVLVKDALKDFFNCYGIPQDAYTRKTFVIQVGPIPIHVPNIEARVKIARFHDLHHILTSYPANWLGEAEIGAWELATGCRTSFIAWFLNSGAMVVGLFINPNAVVKAFKRGRQSATNLYHDFNYEELLSLSVGEVRKKIGLAN